MECGFLVGNILLTLACVGIVAIFKEIYQAWLWRSIEKNVKIIIEIEDKSETYIEFVHEYVKWSSINAQVRFGDTENRTKQSINASGFNRKL